MDDAELRRAKDLAEQARRLSKSIVNADVRKTLQGLAAEYDRLVIALLEERNRQENS